MMATRIMFGMDPDVARWSCGASCGEITCGPSICICRFRGSWCKSRFRPLQKGSVTLASATPSDYSKEIKIGS